MKKRKNGTIGNIYKTIKHAFQSKDDLSDSSKANDKTKVAKSTNTSTPSFVPEESTNADNKNPFDNLVKAQKALYNAVDQLNNLPTDELFKIKISSSNSIDLNAKTKNEFRSEQEAATYQIIKETIPSSNMSSEETSILWRLRSDRLFAEREKRIAAFNPFSIESYNQEAETINSVERAFLKKINNNPIEKPNVAAYWIYEYNIDFDKIMTKLLKNQYLRVSTVNESISYLTIPELKDLLKDKGLKLTGKKSELVLRVQDSYSEDEICAKQPNLSRHYVLTSLGESVIANLHESATKDLEFEDACIAAIINGDINGAYQLICSWDNNKIIPSGIGRDWNGEYLNDLPDYQIKGYTDFLSSRLFETLDAYPDEEQKYKTCIIFCNLLHKDSRDMVKVFKRISCLPLDQITILENLIPSCATELQDTINTIHTQMILNQ